MTIASRSPPGYWIPAGKSPRSTGAAGTGGAVHSANVNRAADGNVPGRQQIDGRVESVGNERERCVRSDGDGGAVKYAVRRQGQRGVGSDVHRAVTSVAAGVELGVAVDQAQADQQVDQERLANDVISVCSLHKPFVVVLHGCVITRKTWRS